MGAFGNGQSHDWELLIASELEEAVNLEQGMGRLPCDLVGG